MLLIQDGLLLREGYKLMYNNIYESVKTFFLSEGVKKAKELYGAKIGEDVFNQLVSFDSSPTKKYVEWMAKMVVNGYDRVEHLGDVIDAYHRAVESMELRGVESDLYQYKTVEDVEKKLFGEAISQSESPVTEDEYEKIYDSGKWLVVHPKTYRASKKYGKGSKWCVAMENDPYYWYKYTIKDRRTFYYVINKEDDREKYSIEYYEDGDFTVWNAVDAPQRQINNKGLGVWFDELGIDDSIVSSIVSISPYDMYKNTLYGAAKSAVGSISKDITDKIASDTFAAYDRKSIFPSYYQGVVFHHLEKNSPEEYKRVTADAIKYNTHQAISILKDNGYGDDDVTKHVAPFIAKNISVVLFGGTVQKALEDNFFDYLEDNDKALYDVLNRRVRGVCTEYVYDLLKREKELENNQNVSFMDDLDESELTAITNRIMEQIPAEKLPLLSLDAEYEEKAVEYIGEFFLDSIAFLYPKKTLTHMKEAVYVFILNIPEDWLYNYYDIDKFRKADAELVISDALAQDYFKYINEQMKAAPDIDELFSYLVGEAAGDEEELMEELGIGAENWREKFNKDHAEKIIDDARWQLALPATNIYDDVYQLDDFPEYFSIDVKNWDDFMYSEIDWFIGFGDNFDADEFADTYADPKTGELIDRKPYHENSKKELLDHFEANEMVVKIEDMDSNQITELLEYSDNLDDETVQKLEDTLEHKDPPDMKGQMKFDFAEAVERYWN